MSHHDPSWDSTSDPQWNHLWLQHTGPLDPFLDDPNDPSSLLDDLDPVEPLTDVDRREIAADLAELEEFEVALMPHAILGIVVDCGDCGEQHFFSWALMAANLRSLLGDGRTGMHEPAAEPTPEAYVSWDYARGFTDALAAHRS